MANWEEVKEKIGAGSKVVADKAKEIIDVAGLRAQIVSCDTTMLKAYKDLGKAFYEAHKDEAAGEFAELIATLKNAEDKKAGLEKKIAEARDKGATDIVDVPVDEPDDSTFEEVAKKVASDVEDIAEDIKEEVSEEVLSE